jgi:WD40 repeat protein
MQSFKEQFLSMAFSPDGTRLAGAVLYDATRPSLSRTVQVWDLTTSRLLLGLTGHKINVASVAFSPNGSVLATSGHDNVIRLWDATTGQGLFVLKGHITSVVALAFAWDGKTLASGGTDGTVKLWHVQTGQELSSQRIFPGQVSRLTFSPTGNALAVGFSDANSPMQLLRGQSLVEIDAVEKAQALAK